MNTAAKFATEGVFPSDNLIAGNAHLLNAKKVIVISGQNLVRGAVLGKITASGKYALSVSAADDGSQTPDLILADDCDATSADQTALAYSRGDFGDIALTIGAGHTLASIAEGLRVKGITIFNVTA